MNKSQSANLAAPEATKEIVRNRNTEESNPLVSSTSKNEDLRWTVENEDDMDDEDYQFSEFLIRKGTSHFCKLCPFRTSYKKGFGRHIQEEHPECERYQCKFCQKEYLHIFKCMNHIKSTHYPELEMKECKSNADSEDAQLLFRNCYTIIPSKADFIYVKANEVIGHNEQASTSKNVNTKKMPEKDKKSEQVTIKEEVIDKIAKKPEGKNYQITDEDGNFYCVNSDGEIELIAEEMEENGETNTGMAVADASDDDEIEENDDAESVVVVAQVSKNDKVEIITEENAADNNTNDSSAEEQANLPSSNFTNDHPPPPSSSVSVEHLPKVEIQKCKIQKRKSNRLKNKAKPKPKVNGGHKRPKLSYSQLIYLAITNSVDKSQSVNQMCSFAMDRFPYYRLARDKKLRGGIRRTLCQHKCFSRVPIHHDPFKAAKQQLSACYTLSSDRQAIAKLEETIQIAVSKDSSMSTQQFLVLSHELPTLRT